MKIVNFVFVKINKWLKKRISQNDRGKIGKNTLKRKRKEENRVVWRNGEEKQRHRPMVRRRQILSHHHVFHSHSSLLRSRFLHFTSFPPPPRHFHRIRRFSPRRRRQRSRRSSRLFPLFWCFLQRCHCWYRRCCYLFLRSFCFPIQNVSASLSSSRHFPCLISFHHHWGMWILLSNFE